MVLYLKYCVAAAAGTIVFIVLQFASKILVYRRSPPDSAIAGEKPLPLSVRMQRMTMQWMNNLTGPSTLKNTRKSRLLLATFASFLILTLTQKPIFALLLGFVVYAAVAWHYARKRDKQRELFDEQLIEGLGVLRSSVRAGQSLGQAIETLVRESRPPLSAEFADVLRKTRLGMPLSASLYEMSDKLDSNDLRLAVLSMNLAKESGGSMGEILSRLCETMRERRKIKGKIRALTAQGKASGMVMSCAPFLLLLILYLMEPDIMGLLFTTLPGNIMLSVVVVMIAVGAFFVNRIVQIDI